MNFITRWISKRRGLQVATPAIEQFAHQTQEAEAELAQQRLGTGKESRLRKRVLAELDLELKLYKRGKG